MRGIDTLEGMRQLAEEVDANWDGVQAKLERIRDLMVDRRNLIVNLSAEDKGFSGMPPRAPSESCCLRLPACSRAHDLRAGNMLRIAGSSWVKAAVRCGHAAAGCVVRVFALMPDEAGLTSCAIALGELHPAHAHAYRGHPDPGLEG